MRRWRRPRGRFDSCSENMSSRAKHNFNTAGNLAGTSRRNVRRRGTILILTMTVCFALAAVVVVLTRKMLIEGIAAANQAAVIQADGVERGAEQYILGMINTNTANGNPAYTVMDYVNQYPEDYFAGIAVGADTNNPGGWFWVVRPNYEEDDLPLFGLVDECSKIDINTFGQPNTAAAPSATADRSATYEQAFYYGMLALPGMTDEIANSIIDWRDINEDSNQVTGSESPYYTALEDPYYAKNAAYEHLEELLMVYGIEPSYIYGNPDRGEDPLGVLPGVAGGINGNDPMLDRGWYDLLTVHGLGAKAAGGGGGGAGGGGGGSGTISYGAVNINTAPRPVLQALLYSANQDPGAAETIISYRQSNQINGGTIDTSWVSSLQTGIPANQLTGQSYRYSADIVAVSRNGRGFKRVRVIIDTQTTPATIISRRDVTDRGWPLPQWVLDSIRAGEFPGTGVGGYANSTTGGTLR